MDIHCGTLGHVFSELSAGIGNLGDIICPMGDTIKIVVVFSLCQSAITPVGSCFEHYSQYFAFFGC